jgi:4-diphosphocytidyl-2-C-methyl-D-erythritol kinase
MVFADIGDELRLNRQSEGPEFAVEGPFAGDMGGDEGNLVVRARDALLATLETPPSGFSLTLDKRLPVASGLGGGSADAAAALRLLRRAFDLPVSDERSGEIARRLGSDVSACLWGQPVVASGRGDVLTPAPILPTLHLVLANPRVTSSTAAVYRAYDRSPAMADAPSFSRALASAAEVAAYLRTRRNDLEAAAIRLEPRISEVLSVLTAQAETLLARMSGSGATCFALCESRLSAAALSARLRRAQPDWWIAVAKVKGLSG